MKERCEQVDLDHISPKNAERLPPSEVLKLIEDLQLKAGTGQHYHMIRVIKQAKDLHDIPPDDAWPLAAPPARRRVRLASAPGFKLRNALKVVLPPKFHEREIEAQHGDAVALYQELLHEGKVRQAFCVRVLMHFWMLWAVFGGAIGYLMGKISLKVGGE